MSDSSKLWYLSQINLFSAMSPAEMQHMERITSMQTIPKLSPVYLPGDSAHSLYLLKKGRVRISRLSEEGKQMTLSILEPGNIFGELSLVDPDSSHDNIAEALEETLICLVARQDFEDFLKSHSDLSLRITKWMGLRLRQVENKIEDLVFKSAEERLQTLLQRLAQDYPKPAVDGTMIGLSVTQQDLGELTNIARPTVSELLRRLEKKGFLRFQKRKIIILAS